MSRNGNHFVVYSHAWKLLKENIPTWNSYQKWSNDHSYTGFIRNCAGGVNSVFAQKYSGIYNLAVNPILLSNHSKQDKKRKINKIEEENDVDAENVDVGEDYIDGENAYEDESEDEDDDESEDEMGEVQKEHIIEYKEIDCEEKTRHNSLIAKYAVSLFNGTGGVLYFEGPNCKTTEILLKSGVSSHNIWIVERDLNTYNQICDKLSYSIPLENISYSKFYKYLLVHPRLNQKVFYLDYMSTFRGNEKHLPANKRDSCPERDVDLLLHQISATSLATTGEKLNYNKFVLAMTVSLRDGTRSHKETIEYQLNSIKGMFQKYNISIDVNLTREKDQHLPVYQRRLGRRYSRPNGSKMFFMLYVLTKKNPECICVDL